MKDLQPFIQAVNDSAIRVRKVVLVIVTASVLFFIPEWNTFGFGWENSRMMMARKTLEYWGSPSTTRENLEKSGNQAELAWFDRSQQYRALKRFSDRNDLLNLVAKLEKEQTFTVGIPAFNVSIQANDLGIFCGFTFVVLLSMLRMSLARSLANLKITFAQASGNAGEPGLHKDLYYLLTMSQVLTLPPDEYHPPPRRLWGYLSKAFMLLPFLVQLVVAGYDATTYKLGMIQSPTATELSMWGNLLFLGFVVILTYTCIQLSLAYDRIFHDEFAKLGHPPPGHGTGL